MTEIAPMSRGSSPKGAPPAGCTGGVPTKSPGARRKQQRSKRNRNSPGVPHQKEYPCQLYRAKAKVTWHRRFMLLCSHCMCDTKIPRERHQTGATEPPQVQPLFLNEYLITFLNEYIEFLEYISTNTSLLYPSWRESRGRLAH